MHNEVLRGLGYPHATAEAALLEVPAAPSRTPAHKEIDRSHLSLQVFAARNDYAHDAPMQRFMNTLCAPDTPTTHPPPTSLLSSLHPLLSPTPRHHPAPSALA